MRLLRASQNFWDDDDGQTYVRPRQTCGPTWTRWSTRSRHAGRTTRRRPVAPPERWASRCGPRTSRCGQRPSRCRQRPSRSSSAADGPGACGCGYTGSPTAGSALASGQEDKAALSNCLWRSVRPRTCPRLTCGDGRSCHHSASLNLSSPSTPQTRNSHVIGRTRPSRSGEESRSCRRNGRCVPGTCDRTQRTPDPTGTPARRLPPPSRRWPANPCWNRCSYPACGGAR